VLTAEAASFIPKAKARVVNMTEVFARLDAESDI